MLQVQRGGFNKTLELREYFLTLLFFQLAPLRSCHRQILTQAHDFSIYPVSGLTCSRKPGVPDDVRRGSEHSNFHRKTSLILRMHQLAALLHSWAICPSIKWGRGRRMLVYFSRNWPELCGGACVSESS